MLFKRLQKLRKEAPQPQRFLLFVISYCLSTL